MNAAIVSSVRAVVCFSLSRLAGECVPNGVKESAAPPAQPQKSRCLKVLQRGAPSRPSTAFSREAGEGKTGIHAAALDIFADRPRQAAKISDSPSGLSV
jgi:hypothetical protein